MRAIYKCPHCGARTGKNGVYSVGDHAHTCPHCKKPVRLTVTGLMYWVIDTVDANRMKPKPTTTPAGSEAGEGK